MDRKNEYTKKFLEAAGIETTDQTIETKRNEWWFNVRRKDDGGLRLTEQGFEFVQTEAKIKTYTIKFPGQFTITPQILVWLDKFIDSPYYITKKDITVTSERTAFELYLFSGDVQKMGYNKALSKRLSQESSDQD